MNVAQFEHDGNPLIGIRSSGSWISYTKAAAVFYLQVHNIHTDPAWTITDLLEHEEFDLEELAAVDTFVRSNHLEKLFRVPKEARMKAPLARPRKIVALGRNYALHAKEANKPVPDEPILFLKAGSSVIGPDEPIRVPTDVGRVDHEVELAVVIGRTAKGIRPDEALSYVAGYTVLNDVTARAMQAADLANQQPWFRSKSFDTFGPMGPWMVTADEVKDPGRLQIECRVNGKLRQRSSTKHLVFPVPQVLAYISQRITLEPGDVVSTGTPEGIGPIVPGDDVVCRIEKIGELRNPVRKA